MPPVVPRLQHNLYLKTFTGGTEASEANFCISTHLNSINTYIIGRTEWLQDDVSPIVWIL